MRRLHRIFSGLLVLSACSSPTEKPGCMGDDCKMPMADMRPPPGTVDPSCTAPRGTLKKAVVERLIMPTVDEPCAIDVDGDGDEDNALRAVAAGLRAVSFDLQANADAVIRTGELVQLLSLQSEDTADSTCAGVMLRRGVRPQQPPRLDGSDTFQVDEALPATQLLAAISGGRLETLAPAAQGSSMVVRLTLSLPGGFGVEVPLPLLGAHMSARVRPQGITSGQLHGVVRMRDVQERMIPAIAQVMTAVVRRAPESLSAKQIIAHFETQAKCDTQPDLCCKQKPLTCEITPEEVRQNPQTQLILRPDVQMFSGERWAPTAGGDEPDSMSVGLCFTTVPAQY